MDEIKRQDPDYINNPDYIERMRKADIRIDLKTLLDKYKGRICSEFEKVCPCEASLKRMVKEMHDIFAGLEKDIENKYDIYR
jgi:hypothetical protein